MFDSKQVETPFALVDRNRVQANAEKVVNYCRDHGIQWRPHVKTHKSRAIASIQMEKGAVGLTVATPREAEVMATICDDLLIAYPVVGESKLDRIMNLPDSVNLMMGIDSELALKGATESAKRADRRIRILVEVDLGMNRVGLQKEEQIVDLVQLVKDDSSADYKGIMFYPGHIRMEQDRQEEDLGKLNTKLSGILDSLKSAGSHPEIISGGSTPTLWNSHKMVAVTEIRPGTCIFYDLEDLHIGVASYSEVAYSLISTVVSTSIEGQAVIDAGSKALSKESRNSGDVFGMILDRPGAKVNAISEEHGVIDLSESEWQPKVGEMVRVLPSHVCVSANLQDSLYVIEGDNLVEWEMEARGRKVFIP